ncbi:MAG TPA: hypothetical protein VKK79_13495 [Candidatus Lokiarchaeia archaeon]|nr:hypothetical protein [Candidatus Lokiarchaeia archaeon]
MRRSTPVLLIIAIPLVLAIAMPIREKAVTISSNCGSVSPHVAQSSVDLALMEGEWGTVPALQSTNVSVNASGTLVDNSSQLSFTFTPNSAVQVRVLFNNYTFAAQSIPQPTNHTQVFYFRIETNTTDPVLAGVVVSLRYNTSQLMFTDRALWVFSYDYATKSPWARINDSAVDLDNGVVTFTMPSFALTNVEFCLAGQETRFGEFPLWGWILLLASIGVIVFMSVGELVYQGLINVKLKGNDGRVMVKFKRFFGAWGRVFTQLDDRVGGMIEDYFAIPRESSSLPPHKLPFVVSAQGPFNRMENAEDDNFKAKDYEAIPILPRPPVIAQILERNPISTAFFMEHEEINLHQSKEEQSVTYIPKAVQQEKGQPSKESGAALPPPQLESPVREEADEWVNVLSKKPKKKAAKKAVKKPAKKVVKKPAKKAVKKAAKKRAKKAPKV